MAHILLVDNDQDFLQHTAFALEWSGHSVARSTSGNDATVRFVEGPFDLVLTSVFMPEMDGLELIRELRRISPAAKIIVLFGDGRYNHGSYITRAAKALGAAAVLEKGASYVDLDRVIAKVVG